MRLLGRTLKVQAAVWFVWSVAVGIAPNAIVERLMDQPLGDAVWVRASAVMGVVLALLMILVSRKLDELWWWAWAFIVLEVGLATLCMLEVLFGLPAGAEAWPWWAGATVNVVLAGVLMVGMGIAGQDRPLA